MKLDIRNLQAIPCNMLLKKKLYWIDIPTFSSWLPKELLANFQLLEGPPLFGSRYLKFSNMKFMFKMCGSCLNWLNLG